MIAVSERQPAREWLHHHDAAYGGPVWLRLTPDAERVGETQRMTVLWGRWELHQSWPNEDGAPRAFVHAKAPDTDNVRIQVLADPPAHVDFGTGPPPAGWQTETAGLWTDRNAFGRSDRSTALDDGATWDAADLFISHAAEEKAAIARPLAEELRRRGRSAWYEQFELTLGDSLQRSIDIGLAAARYGVVILSHSFFAKQWPQRELDWLAARETVDGTRVILPVWHDLDLADVVRYSPLLADRLAASTVAGVEAIADQIERVLDGDPRTSRATFRDASTTAEARELLAAASERPVMFHEHLPSLLGAHPRTVEVTFKTRVRGVQTLFDAGEPRTGEKFRIALAAAASAPQATDRGAGLYVQLWDADLYVVHPGLTDDAWHHVAVAVDHESAAITIDEQPVRAQVWDGAKYTPPVAAPYPLPLRPATAETALVVGAGQADGSRWARRFEGAIASVRVRPTASPLIPSSEPVGGLLGAGEGSLIGKRAPQPRSGGRTGAVRPAAPPDLNLSRLLVFLCHSSADKPAVRRTERRLKQDGVQTWLDDSNLLPGQDWDHEIRAAVRRAAAVVVFLSHDAVTKTGYLQKEIRVVLDVADEQPPGAIFVIPARLEECEVPERLRQWQWVDLFRRGGYNRLLAAIEQVRSSKGP